MKKSLLLISTIVILQVFNSCKTQYSTSELKANFTEEQIADLKKITEFFKKEMCLYMDSDFKTCYERIPHEYLEATGCGFWSNINFEKQNELYNEISKSTFDEIWDFCKSRFPDSGIEITELCSKYNGKYQKYLLEYGQKNELIKLYADQVIGSGDFTQLQLTHWQILKNKKNFDLNNPNVQLILAVHYLSLNDQQKRNEKPDLPKQKL